MQRIKHDEKTVLMNFSVPLSFRKAFNEKAKRDGVKTAQALRTISEGYVAGAISFKKVFGGKK